MKEMESKAIDYTKRIFEASCGKCRYEYPDKLAFLLSVSLFDTPIELCVKISSTFVTKVEFIFDNQRYKFVVEEWGKEGLSVLEIVEAFHSFYDENDFGVDQPTFKMWFEDQRNIIAKSIVDIFDTVNLLQREYNDNFFDFAMWYNQMVHLDHQPPELYKKIILKKACDVIIQTKLLSPKMYFNTEFLISKILMK